MGRLIGEDFFPKLLMVVIATAVAALGIFLGVGLVNYAVRELPNAWEAQRLYGHPPTPQSPKKLYFPPPVEDPWAP